MTSFLRGAAACAAALVALPAAASAPRATTPEDLTRIAYVSGAAISHRGDRIVFVVTRLDAAQNRYRRNLWIVRSDGTGLRQLTAGDGDLDPQWSPDDRTIAFAATRPETSQIYTIAVDGGEAHRITDEAKGASTPRWSHDGRRILYGAAFTDPASKTRLDAAAAGGTLDPKHATSDVRVTDRLDFESNGTGETFGRHTHLVVVRADGSRRRQITPASPWSETQAAWSYDDRSIAFVSLRRPIDPDRIDADVYTVSPTGGALHRVPLRKRSNTAPTWTHDGRTLLVNVTSRNDPSGMPGVDRVTTHGDAHTIVFENTVMFGDALLTDTKEGGAGCGPLLEPHDRWFVADVTNFGGAALYRTDAATGEVAPLTTRGDEIADCTMNDAGTRIAYTASDAVTPGDVWVQDVAGANVWAHQPAPRRLTNLNAAYAASVRLAKLQPFRVWSTPDTQIDAWFLPANVPRGTRAPTLLEIHGGPTSAFGNAFFHEMQMLAGRGYNVVFANPRGSVGYGYPFTAALAKDWGDPMFRDEMAVVDAVVKRPDVDAQRLGVLGGSYGGYATLWMIGHTHRFKAAVAERVVSNMTSSFLACDECSNTSSTLSFGNAWSNQAEYWRQSPIRTIDFVRTPLLLLHSDDDTRTPLVDSDQWFTLAKALGEPITYVQVPRENHDLNRTGEPIHRIERLHMIADFFAKELR